MQLVMRKLLTAISGPHTCVLVSVLMVSSLTNAEDLEWTHIDAKYRTSTVYIRVERRTGGASNTEVSTGSGCIINEEGYVLTSNHVVPDEEGVISIEGVIGNKTSPPVPLELKERDPANGLALLKFSKGGPWRWSVEVCGLRKFSRCAS
jgi:S1-C subfamily serine protease